MGILFNQGQVCCAGSRILVQDTIYDKFIAALKKEFEAVKVAVRGKKACRSALSLMSVS